MYCIILQISEILSHSILTITLCSTKWENNWILLSPSSRSNLIHRWKGWDSESSLLVDNIDLCKQRNDSSFSKESVQFSVRQWWWHRNVGVVLWIYSILFMTQQPGPFSVDTGPGLSLISKGSLWAEQQVTNIIGLQNKQWSMQPKPQCKEWGELQIDVLSCYQLITGSVLSVRFQDCTNRHKKHA